MVAPPAARAEPFRLLLCFSHLRWQFVFQRPQHLMTRAAKSRSVLFWEEPVFGETAAPGLMLARDASGVVVATPHLPQKDAANAAAAQRRLLDQWLGDRPQEALLAWYYTPMALAFSGHLRPGLTVYDCMDELSGFQNPPPGLAEREAELFRRADLVFTGGVSLFEAKKHRHPRVTAFPSSVDVRHFAKARGPRTEPADQAGIPAPRIGFFGVIDERMDLPLVASTAAALPDVHFVMLGPVAKIDPAALPQAPNLHWLGPKPYEALPAYLGGWTAGWMPFALNHSTRFISPTKTPEFLAAGLPVTSTAIADVVREYGEAGLVAIADASNMAERLRASLAPPSRAWREQVGRRLAERSWDSTWDAMLGQIASTGARQVGIGATG